MPTEDNDKQLAICFENDDLLPEKMARPTFITALELNLTPENVNSARQQLMTFAELPLDGKAVVLRHSDDLPLNSALKLKSALPTPLPFLLALHGRQTSPRQLQHDTAMARSAGIRNFLAVTGNLAPADNTPHPASADRAGYLDAVDILDTLTATHAEQSLAATVNPYVYTPETQCLQYAKLCRKLHHGAQFIIAQAGWDIKKAQELQWFLQMREIAVPVIARIRFLSPAEAANLSQLPEPGLTLPVPFAARLERLHAQPAEFEDFQLTLTTLLAIGYRKLGYAGLLLAGPQATTILPRFLERLQALDQSIDSYNAWRHQWLAFIGDAPLTPYSSSHASERPHYLFTNLLEPDQALFPADSAQLATHAIGSPSKWTALKAALLKPDAPGLIARAAKAVVRPDAKLNSCYGLDNTACPKRLTCGSCGGIRPDGFCENNQAPCFFIRIIQIAAQRNETHLLEN